LPAKSATRAGYRPAAAMPPRGTAGKVAMMQSVQTRENESERYREIIRRAKRARERAVESLRRSRARDSGEHGEQADAAQMRRRIRRTD
jgi:hypothetical protein